MKVLVASLALVGMISSSAFAAVQQEFIPGVSGVGDSSFIKKSAVYFEYNPETQYEINAQVGFITDLQFKSGETITFCAAGDTQRWMIDTVSVAGVPHVYLKPVAANISTNIVINTNQKTYRILANSTDRYTPVVIWTYPEDILSLARTNADQGGIAADDKTNLDLIMKRFKNNHRYSVQSKNSKWIPKTIYDDGTKTFISIPPGTQNDLPVIHILDGKKKALVNYRVSGGWFVVDRIFEKAVMNFSTNKSITITNEGVNKE